ncbi:MAG: hypothetical protein ACLSVD_03800 [Eggerthellaceae bacterium]
MAADGRAAGAGLDLEASVLGARAARPRWGCAAARWSTIAATAEDVACIPDAIAEPVGASS